MDYYTVLGVHPTAEDIVIRAAYKALAQRYHPDRFAGSKEEAHRRMSDLTKAYEVLADPLRRPKYDRRRFTYAESVAARFNGSPRYAPPAFDSGDPQSAGAMQRRSRVALTALMIVVAVLSAFNIYHYSKAWLGTSAAVAPDTSFRLGGATVETAIPKAQPTPPVVPAPATAVAPDPCSDVVAALGLCRPNITAKKK